MNDKERELKMADNGGTRSGTERRKFEYTAYIPERRSGRDRRKGFDRRSSLSRRRGFERRISLNKREKYPLQRKDAFETPT
jgi:hypothetical protein